MHAVEITTFLDERIQELARNRLPDEPQYPAGESQYASFLIGPDEMNFEVERRKVVSTKLSHEYSSDDATPKTDRYEGSKSGYVSKKTF
jgi:hypothetical protein